MSQDSSEHEMSSLSMDYSPNYYRRDSGENGGDEGPHLGQGVEIGGVLEKVSQIRQSLVERMQVMGDEGDVEVALETGVSMVRDLQNYTGMSDVENRKFVLVDPHHEYSSFLDEQISPLTTLTHDHHMVPKPTLTSTTTPFIFTQGTHESLPFDSTTFTTVHANIGLVDQNDNIKTLLREAHRVVKPGGRVAYTGFQITEKCGKSSPQPKFKFSEFSETFQLAQTQAPEEILEILEHILLPSTSQVSKGLHHHLRVQLENRLSALINPGQDLTLSLLSGIVGKEEHVETNLKQNLGQMFENIHEDPDAHENLQNLISPGSSLRESDLELPNVQLGDEHLCQTFQILDLNSAQEMRKTVYRAVNQDIKLDPFCDQNPFTSGQVYSSLDSFPFILESLSTMDTDLLQKVDSEVAIPTLVPLSDYLLDPDDCPLVGGADGMTGTLQSEDGVGEKGQMIETFGQNQGRPPSGLERLQDSEKLESYDNLTNSDNYGMSYSESQNIKTGGFDQYDGVEKNLTSQFQNYSAYQGVECESGPSSIKKHVQMEDSLFSFNPNKNSFCGEQETSSIIEFEQSPENEINKIQEEIIEEEGIGVGLDDSLERAEDPKPIPTTADETTGEEDSRFCEAESRLKKMALRQLCRLWRQGEKGRQKQALGRLGAYSLQVRSLDRVVELAQKSILGQSMSTLTNFLEEQAIHTQIRLDKEKLLKSILTKSHYQNLNSAWFQFKYSHSQASEQSWKLQIISEKAKYQSLKSKQEGQSSKLGHLQETLTHTQAQCQQYKSHIQGQTEKYQSEIGEMRLQHEEEVLKLRRLQEQEVLNMKDTIQTLQEQNQDYQNEISILRDEKSEIIQEVNQMSNELGRVTQELERRESASKADPQTNKENLGPNIQKALHDDMLVKIKKYTSGGHLTPHKTQTLNEDPHETLISMGGSTANAFFVRSRKVLQPEPTQVGYPMRDINEQLFSTQKHGGQSYQISEKTSVMKSQRSIRSPLSQNMNKLNQSDFAYKQKKDEREITGKPAPFTSSKTPLGKELDLDFLRKSSQIDPFTDHQNLTEIPFNQDSSILDQSSHTITSSKKFEFTRGTDGREEIGAAANRYSQQRNRRYGDSSGNSVLSSQELNHIGIPSITSSCQDLAGALHSNHPTHQSKVSQEIDASKHPALASQDVFNPQHYGRLSDDEMRLFERGLKANTSQKVLTMAQKEFLKSKSREDLGPYLAQSVRDLEEDEVQHKSSEDGSIKPQDLPPNFGVPSLYKTHCHSTNPGESQKTLKPQLPPGGLSPLNFKQDSKDRSHMIYSSQGNSLPSNLLQETHLDESQDHIESTLEQKMGDLLKQGAAHTPIQKLVGTGKSRQSGAATSYSYKSHKSQSIIDNSQNHGPNHGKRTFNTLKSMKTATSKATGHRSRMSAYERDSMKIQRASSRMKKDKQKTARVSKARKQPCLKSQNMAKKEASQTRGESRPKTSRSKSSMFFNSVFIGQSQAEPEESRRPQEWKAPSFAEEGGDVSESNQFCEDMDEMRDDEGCASKSFSRFIPTTKAKSRPSAYETHSSVSGHSMHSFTTQGTHQYPSTKRKASKSRKSSKPRKQSKSRTNTATHDHSRSSHNKTPTNANMKIVINHRKFGKEYCKSLIEPYKPEKRRQSSSVSATRKGSPVSVFNRKHHQVLNGHKKAKKVVSRNASQERFTSQGSSRSKRREQIAQKMQGKGQEFSFEKGDREVQAKSCNSPSFMFQSANH